MATDKGFGGSESFSLNKLQRNSKIALGVSGAALLGLQALPACANPAAPPASIKSISFDRNQQVVVQFANNGSFPAVPHLLDVPGPSHRVVFDFVNASLDRGALPSPQIFTERVAKSLPLVRSVRYQTLTSTPKPTARIVIDLPEKLEVKPKVVKLEEDMVVLSLGEGVDLSAKPVTEEGGPKSFGGQQQNERVAGSQASGSKTLIASAPKPGGHNPAAASQNTSAESTDANELITESAGDTPMSSPSADESAAQGAPVEVSSNSTPVETAPSPGSHVAADSAGDGESNVGTWDWTAGQASQAAEPAVKTAQATSRERNAGSVAASTNASVAKNAAPRAIAQAGSADDSAIQAELHKESGAGSSAAPVELKPAMPEPEETGSGAATRPASAPASAPAPAGAAPVESEPVSAEPEAPAARPTLREAPVPGSAQSQPIDVTGDDSDAPAPVLQKRVPPKRAAAPVKKEEPIEQEVRTETADQAPEAEVDGPGAGVSADNKAQAKDVYNKAVQAHLSGKLDEAIAAYQKALTINPEFSQAHCNLGLIYNQQHNYAKALSEFRKSLAINPRDAITYNGIGAALRAQKDMLGAIKNWQTAVSLDPKLATAHYNLGTAYEIQKEPDKALESYKQAVKNDYRLGEAYYRMGLIMEKKHLTDEASAQYERALKVANNAEFSEDARQRLATLTNQKRAKR